MSFEPLDLVGGSGVDSDQGPVRLNEHVTVHLRRRTVYPRFRILSTSQTAVRDTIDRFGMATASQLRRLHYAHKSPRGAKVTCSDHLLKMTKRGVIHRIPHPLNNEYVYAPAGSNARMPSLHTLDITELYVNLHESVNIHNGVYEGKFDPEPWSQRTWRGHKVTPDAYIEIGGRKYWAEIDLSSESPSVIGKKMNRYVNAFNASYTAVGEEQIVFPQVIWFAHTQERVRTLQREADKRERGLFKCALFSQALEVLGG